MAVLDDVEILALRMWNTPLLTRDEIEQLSAEFREAIWASASAGKPYSTAFGSALGFLARPDAEEFLRNIQHDLAAQLDIVSRSFDDYLATGQEPAPHYPLRVAILLAKAGHKRHEMAFVAAWCKHFAKARNAGGTYGKLAERGRKLGVYR